MIDLDSFYFFYKKNKYSCKLYDALLVHTHRAYHRKCMHDNFKVVKKKCAAISPSVENAKKKYLCANAKDIFYCNM